MSGLPTTSDRASRGGIGVVLFVFCTLGFLLALAVEAANEQLSPRVSKAARPAGVFDANPIADLIQPAPSYSPEDVVEIQLQGLASSDISRGIQQCFVFASTGNRQTTGPLPRFAVMVRQPPYAVLMQHQLTLVGTPIVEGESAAVVVTVLDDHNGIHVFQFLLSKQHDGTVKGCWMTDAVYPLEQVPQESPRHSVTAGTSSRALSGGLIATMQQFYWGPHG